MANTNLMPTVGPTRRSFSECNSQAAKTVCTIAYAHQPKDRLIICASGKVVNMVYERAELRDDILARINVDASDFAARALCDAKIEHTFGAGRPASDLQYSMLMRSVHCCSNDLRHTSRSQGVFGLPRWMNGFAHVCKI